MKLNQLKDNPGARHTRILVGRGIGSTKGKTCGRGVKGQKARTGVALKGFEGGQSPLLRRMPKRGFSNYTGKCYATVTLGMLQDAIDAKRLSSAKTIDAAALVEAGVVPNACDGLKIIGSSGLKAKATIVAVKATAGATQAVEKAGGKIEILPAKVNKLLKEKKAAK
jgi:large subunit ribosomal protein L15